MNEAEDAYMVIARVLGFRRKPGSDTVWIDVKGEHYIQTRLGFMSANVYNYKYMLQQAQWDLDVMSDDYTVMKHRYEKLLEDFENIPEEERISRTQRTHIKNILKDGKLNDAEKLKKIKSFISRKVK